MHLVFLVRAPLKKESALFGRVTAFFWPRRTLVSAGSFSQGRRALFRPLHCIFSAGGRSVKGVSQGLLWPKHTIAVIGGSQPRSVKASFQLECRFYCKKRSVKGVKAYCGLSILFLLSLGGQSRASRPFLASTYYCYGRWAVSQGRQGLF